MKDHYTLYLRSYCAWNGDDTYAFCSEPSPFFWFNPVEVWGLNSTGVNIAEVLPRDFRNGLETYHAASKALFALYAASLAATCFTLAVGITAIFSRWGSLFTTFFADIGGLILLGASILASILFMALRTALNDVLKKEYGIESTLGTKPLVVTWIGCAFAVGAGFFWLLSTCCFGGRSPYNPGSKEARRTRAEKTPYTYERVGSPYLGPRDSQAVPLNNLSHVAGYNDQRQTAYEPFRPQHV